MSKDTFKIVDLFSGAGGFSLGFDNPECLNGIGNLGYSDLGFDDFSFETILAVDQYDAAAETVKENFDADVIQNDISEISGFRQWSHADIVLGGPPCQGFSNLNSSKTDELDDDRNTLWREFFKAVSDIDPEVFLLENVPRFLSSKEGLDAVRTAKKMGYTTIVDTLSAEEYGVPQRRERGFIFGSKSGTPFFPMPTTKTAPTVREAIGDLPREPTDENWHDSRNFSDLTIKRMKQIPEGGNRFDLSPDLLPDCWKDYEDSGHDLFGRLLWDEPAVTIRTGFHKPMKGRHIHPDPSTHRALTVREGARLQTIPDDFDFSNPYQVHVTNLIGNAVPPKLSYEIARAVGAHLQGQTGQMMAKPETEHQAFDKALREIPNPRALST
ncbi:DNA cytosine methyltransferase [Haloarcula sp. CGMCC 1.6347]|uniref:DNA cytosine methyltransferase n=1 Tax=Haloarcula sp. CGMCC 1.6347 TaxID=3111455 RepID=UPI00300E79F6